MTRARSATRDAWLVRLYPAGWRERYEDEFVAMLEDARPSLTDYADILLGALDARLFLRDTTGGTLSMLTRYRAANVAVFCPGSPSCWRALRSTACWTTAPMSP